MDNTERLNNLEKRVERLETTLNEDLIDIKTDLAVIKEQTSNFNVEGDLKNSIIKKDIQNNENRLKKLEDNQKWFVLAILGLAIQAIGRLIFK